MRSDSGTSLRLKRRDAFLKCFPIGRVPWALIAQFPRHLALHNLSQSWTQRLNALQ